MVHDVCAPGARQGSAYNPAKRGFPGRGRGVGCRTGNGGWDVADQIRRVLDTIVQQLVLNTELRAVELDASAEESGSEIVSDQQVTMRRELDRADDLAPAFRDGLVRAWQRARTGESLTLDDRDPEENRIADALIRFLVSYDLAESRSTETDTNHYVYAIAVDWPRLGEIARDAGVEIEQVLDRLAGQTTP